MSLALLFTAALAQSHGLLSPQQEQIGGACLTSNIGDGNQLWLRNCAGDATQQWFTADGAAWVVSQANRGLCWSAESNDPSIGSTIFLHPCGKATGQLIQWNSNFNQWQMATSTGKCIRGQGNNAPVVIDWCQQQPAQGLCTAELNAKRQQYRGINTPLNWNDAFAQRSLQVANPWVGHWGLGEGPGGFVTGQIEAGPGVSDCSQAVGLWVENEMSSPGVCAAPVAPATTTHCSIILDSGATQVGCAQSGNVIVCDFA